MPPKRRADRARIANDMRLRMIHNRSHGPHHPRPADACTAPEFEPELTATRRARLSQALRGIGRPVQAPPQVPPR